MLPTPLRLSISGGAVQESRRHAKRGNNADLCDKHVKSILTPLTSNHPRTTSPQSNGRVVLNASTSMTRELGVRRKVLARDDVQKKKIRDKISLPPVPPRRSHLDVDFSEIPSRSARNPQFCLEAGYSLQREACREQGALFLRGLYSIIPGFVRMHRKSSVKLLKLKNANRPQVTTKRWVLLTRSTPGVYPPKHWPKRGTQSAYDINGGARLKPAAYSRRAQVFDRKTYATDCCIIEHGQRPRAWCRAIKNHVCLFTAARSCYQHAKVCGTVVTPFWPKKLGISYEYISYPFFATRQIEMGVQQCTRTSGTRASTADWQSRTTNSSKLTTPHTHATHLTLTWPFD